MEGAIAGVYIILIGMGLIGKLLSIGEHRQPRTVQGAFAEIIFYLPLIWLLLTMI